MAVPGSAVKVMLEERYRRIVGEAKQHGRPLVARHSLPSREPSRLRMRRLQTRLDDFELKGTLGQGVNGEVRLCMERASGELFAIKSLHKAKLTTTEDTTRAYAEREVLAEMTAVRECAQWAPRLHQCFQDANHLWLVLEYVPGGDLLSLLQRRGLLPEAEAFRYACEIVAAIGAVHSLGFIHRDVKPDNILIDASGHLKLTDFGLTRSLLPRPAPQQPPSPAMSGEGRWRSSSADWRVRNERSFQPSQVVGYAFARPSRGMFGLFGGGSGGAVMGSAAAIAAPVPEPGAYSKPPSPRLFGSGACAPQLPSQLPPALSRRTMAYSIVGTPNYVAPELLLRQGHSFEADWWSVGIVTFEMLCGYPPFSAPTTQETCDRIVMCSRTLHIPTESLPLSAEVVRFIRRLLCARTMRLGIGGLREVQDEPWFAGTDWSSLRTLNAPYVPVLSDPNLIAREENMVVQELDMQGSMAHEPNSNAAHGGSTKRHSLSQHFLGWDLSGDIVAPSTLACPPKLMGPPASVTASPAALAGQGRSRFFSRFSGARRDAAPAPANAPWAALPSHTLADASLREAMTLSSKSPSTNSIVYSGTNELSGRSLQPSDADVDMDRSPGEPRRKFRTANATDNLSGLQISTDGKPPLPPHITQVSPSRARHSLPSRLPNLRLASELN